MNIYQFIKAREEFSELPFLVVFRTMRILEKNGYLKEKSDGMDTVQPQS